jgi:ADP-ribose pyrophosphatase
MIQPWKKVSSRPAGDFRIFTARWDERVSPRTGRTHEFIVLDSLDWVNIVAVTPDQQVVLVEQYRHGSDTVELEIPGGLLDNAQETPLQAGLRELREETGYEGEQAQVLCEQFPNPAFLSNRCYTVLALNCTVKHPLNWDHGEDLVTRLVPADQLPGLVASGQIRHSIIIAALYHFELWRQKAGTGGQVRRV